MRVFLAFTLFCCTSIVPAVASAVDWPARADRLERLHSLLVLQAGEPVVEHVRRGPGLDRPVSIKSLSKTVLSALAGIAIERGFIESVDRPVVELLGYPERSDPRLDRITLAHALSLRTGLRSTSGRYYGAWVQSDNWVEHVLSRPFVDEPGGSMIYSTGASHLVSAVLAHRAGRTTHQLARDWLGEPLGISIPDWMTDPQGIHFGGNQMLMSPRALARFGEMYRCGGRHSGQQIVPSSWVEASWTAYGTSPWSGDDYGYGWFITKIAGERVYYGRGYGGQALFVVPAVSLTIVITSDPTPPSPGGRYFDDLRRLAAGVIGNSEVAHRVAGCSEVP